MRRTRLALAFVTLGLATLVAACQGTSSKGDEPKAASPAPAPEASPDAPAPLATKIAERPYFTLSDALDRNLYGNGFEPGMETVWAPFHEGVHASLYYVATRGSIPLHYHKAHEETLYVLDGEGSLVFADHRVKLHAGVMVRLEPGIAHGWEGERRNPLKALVIVTPPYAPGERDLVDSRVDAPGTLAPAWIMDVTSTDALPALPPPGRGQSPSTRTKRVLDSSRFSTVAVTAIRQGKIPDHTHAHHDEIAIVFAKAGYAFVRANEAVNIVEEGSIMYLPEGAVHSVEHTAEGHMRAVTIHVPAYDENTDFQLVNVPAAKPGSEPDGELHAPTDPGYFRAPAPMNPRIIDGPNQQPGGGG